MMVFVSYHFDDAMPEHEQFVHRMSYHLNRQPDVDCYCYADGKHRSDWRHEVAPKLEQCDSFVLVLGRALGGIQRAEAESFRNRIDDAYRHLAVVQLADIKLPNDLFQFLPRTIEGGGLKAEDEEICAEEVYVKLGGEEDNWIASDGLPLGYPFAYEKNIISEFVDGCGRLESPTRLEQGCLRAWPRVGAMRHVGAEKNPLLEKEIGAYRAFDNRIIVDTRSRFHAFEAEGDNAQGPCLAHLGLAFPEAGPRELLVYPTPTAGRLTVGIVVSGGIAPGINSVIAGIVDRHELYRSTHTPGYGLNLRGYVNGLASLQKAECLELTADGVRRAADEGGSILGTSRSEVLLGEGGSDATDAPLRRSRALEGIVRSLDAQQVDILYVIGGDGTMRAAHAIWTRAQAARACGDIARDTAIVAIPKTMDNDILWIWQSFGFLSAVEKAREFTVALHVEARSNPRLCVVQLFGSDSGFVVGHAALASRVCDLALIPEASLTMKEITGHVRQVLAKRLQEGLSAYGIVLMAETAIPTDVELYLNDPDVNLEAKEREAVAKFIENGRRVHGQTPDELRSAGLKIVSRVLQREIRMMGGDWAGFRVFTNEPRHLLRAIAPGAQDVIFCQRLGTLAVDSAMAGYTDVMISQWLTEFVLVPLPLVVLGRKRVPKTGMFWKSVLANTGQPQGEPEEEDR